MRFVKTKEIVNPDFKVDFFSKLIASWFFTGYFPKGSGTVGSLAAFVIFLFPSMNDPYMLSIAFLIVFILGTYATIPMMKRYGNDPSTVVVDEVVGQWFTIMIVMAAGYWKLNFICCAVTFIGFRGFDILKLQPAKYFDRKHTALGVMLDDVMAAIYGGVASIFAIILLQRLLNL
ncbi:MAG: phosphatidylglycerophosphatase A [Bacteroidetes bacterium]|nr:phosphatidylglycerophosphatase A [Bacteroidota bacterium]